jgi:TolB-like protein/Flp pilus assembly protein TadD
MGMADTLITKLSGSGDMIVPSLTSVRSYAGVNQDPLSAGRKLGVSAVLEGNVQKAGDRLRVTVRLIKVADGSSLWSSTFDEKFTDVFTIQDTISQKVVDALALRLNAEERKRLTKRYTEDVAAYQLYLTGRFHWNKLTPPEVIKSIGFFQQSVEADPGYALAYFGLAEAYRTLGITGDRPPRETFPKAKEAANKALQLDPSLAEPHSTLAMVHLWFDWDWAASEREAIEAIRLDPTSGVAHLAYAQFLSSVGRHAEAIPEAVRGRELDPVSLISNTREGAMLYLARRHEEAVARLQKALELDPTFWIAQMFLGKTYLELGRNAEALTALNKAVEFSRGNPEAISMVGYFAARSGDQAQARVMLERLHSLAAERYVPQYHIAFVHAVLEEQDEAVAELERAYDERDPRLTLLKVEPAWDQFRSNQRFVDLLGRIGLQ